ncbi:MAG: hypothetical protein A4E35_01066 [Methanoregula sp. PtaU1.Bin051]|nr:MAG: hypothetical protein A4E35_01066 [Methanoregula sp. PtaU1.Bin051]
MACFMIFLLCLAAGAAGCVNKAMQMAAGGSDNSALSGEPMTDAPQTVSGTPDLDPTVPVPQAVPAAVITPLKSELVTEALPIVTPDPYPIIHGTRINQTPEYNRLYREPEFEKTYTLRGNATAFVVNVVEGPLYILFEITPQYDCLANPASCRGTLKKPVNRPYLTITVRDNRTHEIVAEDGYGREFSSDTGNYEFVITDDEGTSTSTPGPRFIPIYREGQFHVTITGNYLDVKISIVTGESPNILDVRESGGRGAAAPTPVPEDEWL